MPSRVKEVTRGKPCYYVAFSKRVNGKFRIVHQTHFGSLDRPLALDRIELAPAPNDTPPLDLSASPSPPTSCSLPGINCCRPSVSPGAAATTGTATSCRGLPAAARFMPRTALA